MAYFISAARTWRERLRLASRPASGASATKRCRKVPRAHHVSNRRSVRSAVVVILKSSDTSTTLLSGHRPAPSRTNQHLVEQPVEPTTVAPQQERCGAWNPFSRFGRLRRNASCWMPRPRKTACKVAGFGINWSPCLGCIALKSSCLRRNIMTCHHDDGWSGLNDSGWKRLTDLVVFLDDGWAAVACHPTGGWAGRSSGRACWNRCVSWMVAVS